MLDNAFRDKTTTAVVRERFATFRDYLAAARDMLVAGRNVRGLTQSVTRTRDRLLYLERGGWSPDISTPPHYRPTSRQATDSATGPIKAPFKLHRFRSLELPPWMTGWDASGLDHETVTARRHPSRDHDHAAHGSNVSPHEGSLAINRRETRGGVTPRPEPRGRRRAGGRGTRLNWSAVETPTCEEVGSC